MTAYVYTFLASDGTVLYVGCTENIGHRITQHGTKTWWWEVSKIEVNAHPDLAGALLAEAARIRKTQPAHNTTFTDKGRTGGWTTRRAHLVGPHNRPRCYVPECVCNWPKTPEALAAVESNVLKSADA